MPQNFSVFTKGAKRQTDRQIDRQTDRGRGRERQRQRHKVPTISKAAKVPNNH